MINAPVAKWCRLGSTPSPPIASFRRPIIVIIARTVHRLLHHLIWLETRNQTIDDYSFLKICISPLAKKNNNDNINVAVVVFYASVAAEIGNSFPPL